MNNACLTDNIAREDIRGDTSMVQARSLGVPEIQKGQKTMSTEPRTHEEIGRKLDQLIESNPRVVRRILTVMQGIVEASKSKGRSPAYPILAEQTEEEWKELWQVWRNIWGITDDSEAILFTPGDEKKRIKTLRHILSARAAEETVDNNIRRRRRRRKNNDR